MKVLIACEESQAVCKAFRDKGHEAYSCDIQDCSVAHNAKAASKTFTGIAQAMADQWE